MSPDELLAQLKANANARKVKNLETLNDVCREQFERGSKDFSIALIGRLSEEKGGPATQSIRNKTGGDFKALISSWATHTGGSIRRQPRNSGTPASGILDKIPDPAVRAVVGIVLAENKKLKGEVNILKQNSNVTIDFRPVAPVTTEPQQVVKILPTFDGLTPSEKESLKHALSEKMLQDEGWKSDDSGRVMSERGRVIFKAGFLSAIRKIVVSFTDH